MSIIITECTDRLVEKFQKIVENGEKLDAKKYQQSANKLYLRKRRCEMLKYIIQQAF